MDTLPTSDAIAMESSPVVLTGRAQVISASNSRVQVHCNACDSYLGIFENEWIRLTSSYARPVQQGVHYGTDISQNTRIVPTSTTHRSAEGCLLSDVVCQKCSTTVGQYCREAPTVEQHYLERVYFYKLSKVTLKDSNLEPKDAIFAYGEEDTPERFGSPVPSVVAPDPKWSHPPPIKSHLRNVLHSDGMLPPPSRHSWTPAKAPSEAYRSSVRPHSQQTHVSRETSSARASSMASQVRPRPVRVAEPAETPEGLLTLRTILQQNVAFEKMVKTVENLQREVREMRTASAPSQETTVACTRTEIEDEELQALRAENYALKKVLKNLPAQTQFANLQYPESHDEAISTPKSNPPKSLGKRKRGSRIADDSLFHEDDGITGGYDDYDDYMNETSGLATLERDAEQGYSIWQGEEDGSEGGEYSEDNDNRDENNDLPSTTAHDGAHADSATGGRHSARSRERRQTLPEAFISDEQRFLQSDSNDENFDPKDPKVKGRRHKRTRSAERRRRERVERQQDSLWKKGVPGGGYENGDGWVEQKRHHSGRFGRKAEVGEGLAVYPKFINDRLFANGRQIPTTHKRLARELVYLGLEDWIDKDKGDALYRRTIRVARKHYAYHHGGISSKALCQGKYTRKDLEQVGMWDDELFEEINLGEESDVEKLDFPLDPKLKVSMEKWKKEGLQAKERMQRAAQEALPTSSAGEGEQADGDGSSPRLDADGVQVARQTRMFDLTGMTEFSDEDVLAQQPKQPPVTEVPDRIAKHKKFDSIWQAPAPTSDNAILSTIQHAEARIRAAEEEMGEPTFKSKKAQMFKTIDQHSVSFPAILSQVPNDTYITPANNKVKRGTRRKAPTADTIIREVRTTVSMQTFPVLAKSRGELSGKNRGGRGSVKEHLALLKLSSAQELSFLKELKTYFAVDKDTGAELSVEQHLAFTDEELMNYSESFLETKVVRVGGSRKIGLDFWPDDGSTALRYMADKETIIKHVYGLVLVRRYNKARNLRSCINKNSSENLFINQVLDSVLTPPGPSAARSLSSGPLRSLRDEQFDNGLRYKGKPGFTGNQHYYADGLPKTAEAAARLKMRAALHENSTRYLPNSLSDEEVLARDRLRRATILDTSSNDDTNLALATPLDREASILPESILQIASTLSQITKAFDDEVHKTDEELDVSESTQNEDEEMDLGTVVTDPDPALKASLDLTKKPPCLNLDNEVVSPESEELQLTKALLSPDSEGTVGPRLAYTANDGSTIIAGSKDALVDATTEHVKKSLRNQPATRTPTMPALLTRSAAKAAGSATSRPDLTETKNPVAKISVRRSPISMSDKENVLPQPEASLSSATENVEPPAKKVKMITKRGHGRPPRKSAAELDRMAKEVMERETQSAAPKSRSGLCFGS